jgi:HAD superfamily hydrolase (TIGR01509 family)
MPGARRLLAEVAAAGVPRALVSSSRRPVVDAVLDAVGRELLPVTVSGDDVERTKPHPDPYLLAAGMLGVDPHACIALEDSATGATSARAAGCLTIVVPSVAGVDDGVADHRLGSLEQLDLARLGQLIGRR